MQKKNIVKKIKFKKLLTTRYSPLTTRYSLLATRHLLLATYYLLLATYYSLLATESLLASWPQAASISLPRLMRNLTFTL